MFHTYYYVPQLLYCTTIIIIYKHYNVSWFILMDIKLCILVLNYGHFAIIMCYAIHKTGHPYKACSFVKPSFVLTTCHCSSFKNKLINHDLQIISTYNFVFNCRWLFSLLVTFNRLQLNPAVKVSLGRNFCWAFWWLVRTDWQPLITLTCPFDVIDLLRVLLHGRFYITAFFVCLRYSDCVLLTIGR